MSRLALIVALLVSSRAYADSLPARTNLDMGSHKVVNVTQATASGDAVAGGRTISAGTGLTGGGALTADRTLSLSVPVTVAHGGTNCTSASGTCVDNLSGFSSTGIIKRTGSGSYSFLGLGTGLTLSGSNIVVDSSALGAALTKTDDTNVTLTLGGAPTTALLGATSLTLGWTGTLGTTRGGSGGNYASTTALFDGITPSSPAKGTLLVYSGSHWVNLGVGTNTYVLTANSGALNGVDWEAGGGGSVTGTGAAGRLTLWSGTSTVTSDAGLLWSTTGPALTMSGSAPVFTMADTTSSAKSLKVTTDGDKTVFEESGGAADNLFTLDLANARIGINNDTPLFDLQFDKAAGDLTVVMNSIDGLSEGKWDIESGEEVMTFGAHGPSEAGLSGAHKQDGAWVESDHHGGLSLMASDAAGDIRFYTAGTADANLRVKMASDGTVTSYGNTTVYGGELVVTKNTSTLPTNSGTLLHLAAANGNATFVTLDSFGSIPEIWFRQAGGTAASRTHTTSGDAIAHMFFDGYGTSAYGLGASIAVEAAEDWTNTAQGTRMKFTTNSYGTTTQLPVMTLTEDGNVQLGEPSSTTGKLTFASDSSGHTLTFEAGTPTASYSYIWPDTDGSSDYVLTTSGHGLLSWKYLGTMIGGGGGGTVSVVTSLDSLGGDLTLYTGTSGTDFAIVDSGTTITFNLPSASTSARGLVTAAAQTIYGNKTFSLNSSTLPAIGGAVIQLAASNSNPTIAMLDAFASGSTVLFRRADTSAASPSAVQTNDLIGQVAVMGYGTTGYSSDFRASLNMLAAQNWTDTVTGTYMTIKTTANGAAAAREIWRWSADGTATTGVSSAGTTPLTGGINFAHLSSSHLTSIVAGNATADWTLTLPTAAPAANGAIFTSSNTSGAGAWVSTLPWANGGTAATTAPAAVDGLLGGIGGGNVTGDLMVFNGSNWVHLATGTSSQALVGGTTPSWAAVSGSGSATGSTSWREQRIKDAKTAISLTDGAYNVFYWDGTMAPPASGSIWSNVLGAGSNTTNAYRGNVWKSSGAKGVLSQYQMFLVSGNAQTFLQTDVSWYFAMRAKIPVRPGTGAAEYYGWWDATHTTPIFERGDGAPGSWFLELAGCTSISGGTPDTNFHTFEGYWNSGNSTMTFKVDGTTIGTQASCTPSSFKVWPFMNCSSNGPNGAAWECSLDEYIAVQAFEAGAVSGY